MEADWNETIGITVPGPSPNGPPAKPTAFAFDPLQELLWIGTEHGRVMSLYGQDLQSYTSYRGHVNTAPLRAPSNAAVKQLLLCARGVISISSTSVHLSIRRGLTQWHLAHPGMVELHCMSFTNRDATEIVVAGAQNTIFRIDVDRGSILEESCPANPSISFTLMRLAGQFLCAAGLDGSIYLLDPKTLSIVHRWKAYAGQVNDMDTRGDYLLVCGWAQMQYQGLALERLVRVYNLKTLQPLPPISFPSGAGFVRIHPKLSSTCIIVSPSGAIQSIDIQNHDTPAMRFTEPHESQYTGMELMPSGRGFALMKSNGEITLWCSSINSQFTEYPHPTEFADASTHENITLEWSLDTPLNKVGMPFYREALLSAWPNSLLHEVGLPPPRLEPLGPTFRPFEYGLVGRNTGKNRRNEAEDTKSQHRSSNLMAAPKFLSEKPREEELPQGTERRISEDIGKALRKLAVDGGLTPDPRSLYRVVEIRYSKFGVDDFDFRFYNRTEFAGLETHIVNSYANPLLQILRFTTTARNITLEHTAQDCRIENCLMCELGFLIDMLEKARSPNCQATNFLKALTKQPNVAAQNILEDYATNVSLSSMIQNLNRYLLLRLEDAFKQLAPSLDQFHRAFATIGLDKTRCLQCGFEKLSDRVWYTHDLLYPQKNTRNTSSRGPIQQFSQVLRNSFEKLNQHRGWCLKCNGYKFMQSQREIHGLPAVLMLNAGAGGQDAKQFWSNAGSLPEQIGVIVNGGRFFCYEGNDLHYQIQRGQYKVTVYELKGVVAEVKTSEGEKPHLVAMADVENDQSGGDRISNWHLFNDFLVHKVSAEDALQFDAQWKLPSVITYQVKSVANQVDDSWKSQIDTSILFRSPSQPALTPDYQFRALSSREALPDSTFHCGLDAEFVRLLREEIDVAADGSRIMTRPARSGLARVSVLRGMGHDQELPFIDDYIAIDERVEDYLTQYSGLHEGDLTPGRSPFKLVTLKQVYKKLWVLLNLGCKFIGHGLSSDFRIINMHVPKSQVIDTQDLFSLKSRGRRKLSLRFLAWVLLGEDIQQDADRGHDSIEDARTAIKLWRKYLEFQEAGIFEQKMDEVWHKGRSSDFKVPSERRGIETPTPSNPGTPMKQPAKLETPGRGEVGSPVKRNEFGSRS